MTETKKPTALFWVIAIVALVWNIFGVLAYLGQAFMTEETLKMLPTAEQELYAVTPSWVTAAFAIAVWFGLLGAIALLIKKRFAYPLFLLSLLGVIGQQVYSYFLSDTLEVYGNQAIIMPVIVLILSIVFVWYSKKSIQEGILK
ncbi:hypothetical protein [Gilvibacter sp. SZ-19]|uniref:hypothetical protein n=1 Tax=unclassified Gilvibacter TaxID=2625242 RepID=UPI000B3C653A|nr:hypothetical protein [Gilvibacter sp. SZ-19]ARV13259.1 hypothetical protein BTO09_13325 [Gilvibacter sp. SZ-19]